MTAAELIALLRECDPAARVVVNEEPLVEGGRDVMEIAMQDVEAIEVGWTDRDIACDLTFSLRPIGEFLVPAIRIVGRNHELTSAERKITINGVSPMKDAPIVQTKRLTK